MDAPDPPNATTSPIAVRGAAIIGPLVVTAPLAVLHVNTAMVSLRAAGFEDTIYKADRGYVQHFNMKWYYGVHIRLVELSGEPGEILFSPSGGYERLQSVLWANGWDIYES